MSTTRLSLTREDRAFLAYALDCAAAHLAHMADTARGEVTPDIIAKFNTDEDKVRNWITRIDPEYVS